MFLAASALHGHDVGITVTYGSRSQTSFRVLAGEASSKPVYESGLSDPINEDWDTILIEGLLPEPSIQFYASIAAAPSRWQKLALKRFTNGRFWAKTRMPSSRDRVLLRAVGTGAGVDHDVVLYRVEVFKDASLTKEPEPTPPIDVPRGPLDPQAPAPAMSSRQDWNAAPPKEPYTPDLLPWRITLHHSAGRVTSSLPETLAEVRFIQDLHQNGRGWNDIGYHYVVDPMGNILEGRPLGSLGAHTFSNNSGNVGIVMLGDYQGVRNDFPTQAQIESLTKVGRFLIARFGISPALLRGHRDYRTTQCPGDRLYVALDFLRAACAPAPIALDETDGRNAQRLPFDRRINPRSWRVP
ncbi:MAG: peptidoglycan recognition family protein [Elusimicrobiota bacterium]